MSFQGTVTILTVKPRLINIQHAISITFYTGSTNTRGFQIFTSFYLTHRRGLVLKKSAKWNFTYKLVISSDDDLIRMALTSVGNHDEWPWIKVKEGTWVGTYIHTYIHTCDVWDNGHYNSGRISIFLTLTRIRAKCRLAGALLLSNFPRKQTGFISRKFIGDQK